MLLVPPAFLPQQSLHRGLPLVCMIDIRHDTILPKLAAINLGTGCYATGSPDPRPLTCTAWPYGPGMGLSRCSSRCRSRVSCLYPVISLYYHYLKLITTLLIYYCINGISRIGATHSAGWWGCCEMRLRWAASCWLLVLPRVTMRIWPASISVYPSFI